MMTHFYSEFEPGDAGTRERHRVARVTWAVQCWHELPVANARLPREFVEEGSRVPYVVDLFDAACKERADDDILVYTNADVCVRSDCWLKTGAAMQDTEAFYSFRRDFNEDFHEPVPDDVLERGDSYVGSDFYAFRAAWWRANRRDFPDLLIGREGWDAVLRHLIEMTNVGSPVNVPNLSYHRRHASQWETPANRHRLKGQIHNLKLCMDWMRRHRIDPASHGMHL